MRYETKFFVGQTLFFRDKDNKKILYSEVLYILIYASRTKTTIEYILKGDFKVNEKDLSSTDMDVPKWYI